MSYFTRNSSIGIFCKPTQHQREWLGAFAKGLDSHGIKYQQMNWQKYTECDIAIIWGLNHRWLPIHSGHYLLLERGHWQDRTRYTSVGWNGLAGRGDYLNKEVPDDRYQKHLAGLVHDWRPNKDGFILMLGQVPGDNSIKGVDIKRTYQNIVSHFRTMWPDREIVFRPHPLASDRISPKGIDRISRGELLEDFKGAYRYWTYNSTASIEATLWGLPGECEDTQALARKVGYYPNADSFDYPYPDRTKWLHELAYTCWTKEEIESGETWEHISGQN